MNGSRGRKRRTTTPAWVMYGAVLVPCGLAVCLLGGMWFSDGPGEKRDASGTNAVACCDEDARGAPGLGAVDVSAGSLWTQGDDGPDDAQGRGAADHPETGAAADAAASVYAVQPLTGHQRDHRAFAGFAASGTRAGLARRLRIEPHEARHTERLDRLTRSPLDERDRDGP